MLHEDRRGIVVDGAANPWYRWRRIVSPLGPTGASSASLVQNPFFQKPVVDAIIEYFAENAFMDIRPSDILNIDFILDIV